MTDKVTTAPDRIWIEPITGAMCDEQLSNRFVQYVRADLFRKVLDTLDSCRMGKKEINQGCFCVSSPTQTNQPDWKHNPSCKARMKVLVRFRKVVP